MRLAAAAAALKRASGGISAPFSLAFLTDRRRIAKPEPIIRALPAGAAVIYRDYDDPGREAVARRYAAICRTRGVLFLVAGDIGLARRVGADGLHLPAGALASPPGEASERREWVRGRHFAGDHRPLTRNRFAVSTSPEGEVGGAPCASIAPSETPLRLTAACHNAEELARAHALGADLALLSPVFATQSHPDTEHLGVKPFKALAAASPIPVLALGGVDEENAAGLAGENVAGFAAIGAFFAAR